MIDVEILLQIFWVFFRISLLSFGGVFGVLPELERQIVHEYQWLTAERFLQSYVLAQFVPGPNMAMCPLIGYWVKGWSGFVAGFLGIYLGPVVVMGGALLLYRKAQQVEWIARSERALRPLVLGLIASSALRFWWLQTQSIEVQGSGHNAQARLLSLGVMALGWFVYDRKYLGVLPTVFLLGALWWSINWIS